MDTLLHNFRKVPLPTGRLEVFRCGLINPYDDRWLYTLQQKSHVQLILDLNSSQELTCIVNKQSKLFLVGHKLEGPDIGCINPNEANYESAYINMLKENMPVIGDIFRYFADGLPTILVSCLFGKDRTGLIIALLESLLSLDRAIIKEDYNLSLSYYLESGDLLHEHWLKRGISRTLYMQRFQINPGFILRVLDYLVVSFGSIERYLLECGLQAAEISEIKSKFL